MTADAIGSGVHAHRDARRNPHARTGAWRSDLHPDTHGGVVSTEMVAVNEAWRVLSDDRRRSAYDANLRVRYRAPSPPAQWVPWSDPTMTTTMSTSSPTTTTSFFGPMAETVAVRRWMVLITFTMIAAALLLTVLFVYAFMRSGSTRR